MNFEAAKIRQISQLRNRECLYLCRRMKLYVFNPEHDYALANNDPHFMAPASACQFANDCASFWSFLADENVEFQLFQPYQTDSKRFDFNDVIEIKPWGWNPLVVHQLREAGAPEKLLPTTAQLARWRTLAHRKLTIPAMNFLRNSCPNIPLPVNPELLTSEQQIADFIARNDNVLLKSPYSGNGRGNLYAHGSYSVTLRRQTLGVIRRQGAILGEPMYNVIQDFAMEFHCQNGQTHFAGYSLFQTLHYGYAGNQLLSDAEIEQRLCQWLSVFDLQQIRAQLLKYIESEIAPDYNGYVGVDMFVYQKDNAFLVNPMVEMNLRMTMGMAAHVMYERYLHPDAKGVMQLLYFSSPGALKVYADAQPPLVTLNGKWRSGFCALNEITEQTQYAVCVSVNDRGSRM